MERLAVGGREADFTVDAYVRVRGVKDGRVKRFGCGLSVGAVWGVDGVGSNCRKNLPPRGYIREAAVTQLAGEPFDVLLTHDAPVGAKRVGTAVTRCGR